MKYQKGSTFINFLILLMFVVVATLAVKIIPLYADNMTIRSILGQVIKIQDIDTLADAKIQEAFGKRMEINDVSAITPRQLVIKHAKDGVVTLSADYSARATLFRNIDVVVTFKNHYQSKRP